MIVSNADPMIDDASGAFHHVEFLSLSKTKMSNSCAIRKADPDANAMRKLTKIERATPRIKPT